MDPVVQIAMESDNACRQSDEVEVLGSIYGDDFTIESDITKTYSIKVEEGPFKVILFVTMPIDYPGQAPPKYEIYAPWMAEEFKENIEKYLDNIYLANRGESIIFQWVEKIREIVQDLDLPEKKGVDE